MKQCSFCDFQGFDIIRHAVQQHSCHPCFFLTCDICGGTWKRYDAFRKHVSRKHPNSTPASAELPNYQDASADDTFGYQVPLPDSTDKCEVLEKQLVEQSAAYILKLKSVHGVSQTCISDIIQQTNEIVKTATAFTREKLLAEAQQLDDVKESLEQTGINWSCVGDVQAFHGIETEWLQNKYFAEKFSLLQPMEVKMGERTVVKGNTIKMKPALGYCVPFLDGLKQFLQLVEVQRAVFDKRAYTIQGEMLDFEDGSFCLQHEIFNKKESLKIVGYFDNVEVVNPIGVHTKKHKLSLFFWTLVNIPPMYRSRLSCIHLIAVAKSRDCKEFGLDLLLHDFIAGLNTLSTAGIIVQAGGKDVILKGGLVAFLGDTLASNAMGGFKEGVGFAHKICRTCEATAAQSPSLLSQDDCVLREYDEHLRRCDLLKSSLTKYAKNYWSRVYGINNSSVLLNVSGFDVTNGLIHDPMHLLFEGVTHLEVVLFLRYAVYDKSYFTLAYLNSAMQAICEKIPADCKPNAIDEHLLKSSDTLKQTAHQMWWLSYL